MAIIIEVVSTIISGSRKAEHKRGALEKGYRVKRNVTKGVASMSVTATDPPYYTKTRTYNDTTPAAPASYKCPSACLRWHFDRPIWIST